MEKSKRKAKILVVAAHPDDEVLGCCGTIAKWSGAGASADLLILGQGLASRGGIQEMEIEKLKACCQKVARLTGYKKVHFENLPDNEFDAASLLSIVKRIEKYLVDSKPDIVFTHHPQDLNIDHRICSEAVLTASRPIALQPYPSCIYFFECLSSTEWRSYAPEQVFIPNVYIDIGKTLSIKKRALKAYRGEIRKYPHPRSIEGIEILAKKRGLEVGLRFAEAFRLVRKIER